RNGPRRRSSLSTYSALPALSHVAGWQVVECSSASLAIFWDDFISKTASSSLSPLSLTSSPARCDVRRPNNMSDFLSAPTSLPGSSSAFQNVCHHPSKIFSSFSPSTFTFSSLSSSARRNACRLGDKFGPSSSSMFSPSSSSACRNARLPGDTLGSSL
ncbi:unnamed protein product, partial [Ixodes pacificus]